MKFISKFLNYRLVLRQGIPAEPLSGRPSVPGISIRFEDGMAEVANKEHVEMMRAHPLFSIDFVQENPDEKVPQDPFFRSNVQPYHEMKEIKYGHVEKIQTEQTLQTVSPEMRNMIIKLATDQAREIVNALLPKLVEQGVSAAAPKLAADMIHNIAAETPAPKKATKVNPNLVAPEALSENDIGATPIADPEVDMTGASLKESKETSDEEVKPTLKSRVKPAKAKV